MKLKILLLLILILSFTVRIYRLTEYPEGVYIDEASYAWNAYSILNTGKDQYGKTTPIFFQSENDFKQPVHIYFSTVAIKLFGLNQFGSRFTAFFFSVLAIFLIYKITYIITDSKKIALLSSFILSVSPWHFLMSRSATDVMTASTLIAFSFLFYLYYHKQPNLKNYLLFFVFSLLALFTYRTTTIFILIFFPIMELIRSGKNFLKDKHSIPIFIAYSILLIIFLTSLTLQLKRYSSVSFTSNHEIEALRGENIREDGVFNRFVDHIFITRFFHNKILDTVSIIFRNYLRQFDFSFLFLKGDSSPNNTNPGIGNFYAFEILLFIMSFIYFAKNYARKKIIIAPLIWIAVSNIPSSLTTDPVNSSRTLQAVLGYVIISAAGFSVLIKMVNRPIYRMSIKVVLIALYFFGFSYMLHQYFIHKPLRMPWYRNSGLQEAVDYIEQNKHKYKKIIFGQDIYTLYVYYAAPNPVLLQESMITKNALVMRNISPIFLTDGSNVSNCNFKNGEINALYVCFGRQIPVKSKIIKVFRFRDDQPSYVLLQYDPTVKIEDRNKIILPSKVEFY